MMAPRYAYIPGPIYAERYADADSSPERPEPREPRSAAASDINARERWRRTSVTAPATRHQVIGHGWRGYLEAIDWLLDAR